MIIIWRGWGILVLLFGAIGGGVAGALSHGNMIAIGVGLAAAAAGMWYLGRWLNELRPKAAFDAAIELRSQELKRIVEVGAYQFPGLAAPQSLEEAQAHPRSSLLGKRAKPVQVTATGTPFSLFQCNIWGCSWRLSPC